MNDVNEYSYYMSVCIIWKSGEIIGYTHSHREADDICNRYTNLVWDYNTREKKSKSGYKIKRSLLTAQELHNLPLLINQ